LHPGVNGATLVRAVSDAHAAASYDAVPYTSAPVLPTHPDCLATVATLFGLSPPRVETCRVLELGCGVGSNLVPMAYALPDARFVGVDLSPRQIEMGQKAAAAAGVRNLELVARSILDLDASFGSFDYVIAHGVYSWVPPEVQGKVLEICSANLAPEGVAYVSYNTYPGWHTRRMVRDMMCFRVKGIDDPREKAKQARSFLEFLTEAVASPQTLHSHIVAEEARMLAKEEDWYLVHEHLDSNNTPVYFRDFVEQARAHGLQFLSEAMLSEMAVSLPAKVKQTLLGYTSDFVELEQYVDFIRNRAFRCSLLCHADQRIERAPSTAVLRRMNFTSLGSPVGALDVRSAGPETFLTGDGARTSSRNPLVRAALHALFEATPRALTFDALCAEVDARFVAAGVGAPLPAEPARAAFAASLLQCALGNLLSLHVQAPSPVVEIEARPRASAVARMQAQTSKSVTNLRHRVVKLQDFDREVVLLADGTHDRAALGALLAGKIEGASADELSTQLDACLGRLQWASLLVAGA